MKYDQCTCKIRRLATQLKCKRFVVCSVYGGGSVEVKRSREAVGSTKMSLAMAKAFLAANLEGLDVAEGTWSVGAFDGQKTKALFKQSTLSWKRGDAALHSNGISAIRKSCRNGRNL